MQKNIPNINDRISILEQDLKRAREVIEEHSVNNNYLYADNQHLKDAVKQYQGLADAKTKRCRDLQDRLDRNEQQVHRMESMLSLAREEIGKDRWCELEQKAGLRDSEGNVNRPADATDIPF